MMTNTTTHRPLPESLADSPHLTTRTDVLRHGTRCYVDGDSAHEMSVVSLDADGTYTLSDGRGKWTGWDRARIHTLATIWGA